MGVLRNARHEKFCQAVVAGSTLTAAYEHSGYKPDRRHAHTLRQRRDISQRIDELLAEQQEIAAKGKKIAIDQSGIDQTKLFQQYARLGFSKITDVCEWDEKGLRFKPSSFLSEDEVASIAEITQTPLEGGGVRLRVKLVDKLAALRDLGRHLGFCDGPAKVSTAEAQAFVRRLLSILQRNVDAKTLESVMNEMRELRGAGAV